MYGYGGPQFSLGSIVRPQQQNNAGFRGYAFGGQPRLQGLAPNPTPTPNPTPGPAPGANPAGPAGDPNDPHTHMGPYTGQWSNGWDWLDNQMLENGPRIWGR